MTKQKPTQPDPRKVRLDDGRELTVRLNALTWREVREYVAGVPSFDPEQPEASTAAERHHAELKGRCCGLTADEVLALGFEDFSRVSRKISDLIVNPVETDPS
jgi:hypothetical protein